MLARSCGRLLAPSSIRAVALRSVARLPAAGLVRTTPILRTFSAEASAPDTPSALGTPSAPGTTKESPAAPEGKEYSSTYRLNYLLQESAEPSQETVLAQLPDEQLENLPFVIEVNKQWEQVRDKFTFPRWIRRGGKESKPELYKLGEYVYNTFHLPSGIHLKRFNYELSARLNGQARPVNAILFMDARSCTVTLGLPTYIGLLPPYPAKDNFELLLNLLNTFRSHETTEKEKKRVASELRKYAIPRGFRKETWAQSRYTHTLFETIQKVTPGQLLNDEVKFNSKGTLGDEPLPDPQAQAKKAMRPRPERKTVRPTSERKEGRPRSEREPRRNNKSSLAEKLQADYPKLPEAGTFVAPDGEAHKGNKDAASEDHVPFPKPSAEEMGIEKPSATSAEKMEADEPKLPEAGTFVAPDGNAHKANKDAALEDRVPFPKPSAEEIWTGRPSTNSADKLPADDPKLPEAGTFVAPDGDAQKPSKGEADAWEEHVPFPKPSAEEMGIKKPTET